MNPSRIKIIFVLPTLKAGGAERILSFLATSLDTKKFIPRLVIIGSKEDAAYPYDPENTFFFEKKRVLKGLPALFLFFWKQRPNIVMSSIGHVNISMGIFSLFFRKTKFIGRIASITSQRSNESTSILAWFIGKIFLYAFNKLDKIICQSKDMEADLIENYGINNKKMILINNPITVMPEKIKSTPIPSQNIRLITVGRLTDIKGHLRLLEILNKLDAFEFHYTMVGKGPLKGLIEKKVNEYNLKDKVTFIEFTSKVYDLLVEHDIFLQGSYVEGFPNAALESCAVGVPVIAFNVPGGTKEIITPGINGHLVETEKEFLNYLENLPLFQDLDPHIISSHTLEKFSSGKILQKYEKVFEELMQ